jgi:hypothetical protein
VSADAATAPGALDQPIFQESQALWRNIIVRVLVPTSSFTLVAMMVAMSLNSPAKVQTIMLSAAGAVVAADALALFGLKQRTVVWPDRVRVSLAPFGKAVVRRADILAADPVSFDALSDFGGWGIKRSKKYGRVFVLAGDSGVLLTLADGSMLLIGSARTAELAQILRPDTPLSGPSGV